MAQNAIDDLGRWHHHVSKSRHVVLVETLDENPMSTVQA